MLMGRVVLRRVPPALAHCAIHSVAGEGKVSPVTYSLSGGVARLTLSNPQKRNILTFDALEALSAHFDTIAASSECRVVVLTSTGPSFSAGHDFRDFAPPATRQRELLSLCSEVHIKLRGLPQPTIVGVQGLATGGGFQLASSFDIIVASKEASFQLPGAAQAGFCHTPAVAVADRINPRAAFAISLMGIAVSATEALRMGLVDRVVPAAQLQAEVDHWATRLVTLGSNVNLRAGKKCFKEQIALPNLRDKYKLAEGYMYTTMTSPDKMQSISSFLDKSKPKSKI